MSDASHNTNESMTTPNSTRERRESQSSNGSDREINKIKQWRQVHVDSVDSIGPMSPTTTLAGDAAMVEYGLRTVSPHGQGQMTSSNSDLDTGSFSPMSIGNNGESMSSLKTIHEAPSTQNSEKTVDESKARDDPLSQLDELVEVAGIEEAYLYVNGMLKAAIPVASRHNSISKIPPGYTAGITTNRRMSHDITYPFIILDHNTSPINIHPTSLHPINIH